jgi:hypothetical protein
MGTAKVTFDLRRGVITVEGTGEDLGKLFDAARAAAPSFKEIRVVSSDVGDGPPSPAEEPGQPDRQTRQERVPAMRDFARRLAMDNASERIALLAYHAREYGGRPYFSAKEMNDWFGLCGFKKPSQMPVALHDARRKYGYVENKGRDQWVLTTGGEHVVLEALEKAKPEA